MKTDEPPPLIEDVELLPDAMERLEGAIKHATRQRPVKPGLVRRVVPSKPRVKRPTRHP